MSTYIYLYFLVDPLQSMKLLQFTWLRSKQSPFIPNHDLLEQVNLSHCFSILYSCFLYCHKTPNFNTAIEFLIISLVLSSWTLERDVPEAPL